MISSVFHMPMAIVFAFVVKILVGNVWNLYKVCECVHTLPLLSVNLRMCVFVCVCVCAHVFAHARVFMWCDQESLMHLACANLA